MPPASRPISGTAGTLAGVHRQDAADLYRLALENAPAGHTVHGIGEDAIEFKKVAEKIGQKLGIPTRSVTAGDAGEHFGNPFMALVFGADVPASSTYTQQLLARRDRPRAASEPD